MRSSRKLTFAVENVKIQFAKYVDEGNYFSHYV
jgi:hypothetical protein